MNFGSIPVLKSKPIQSQSQSSFYAELSPTSARDHQLSIKNLGIRERTEPAHTPKNETVDWFSKNGEFDLENQSYWGLNTKNAELRIKRNLSTALGKGVKNNSEGFADSMPVFLIVIMNQF